MKYIDKHFSWLWLAVGILVVGCGGPKDSGSGKMAGNVPTPENVSAGARPDGSATNKTDANPDSKPKFTVAQVPADLKGSGFEWYGLGNEKPMDLEAKMEPNGMTYNGAQTVEVTGVDAGKATFKVRRTGGLSVLGDNDYEVDATGIYATSSSLGKMDRALEIPAKLEVGTTWDYKMHLQTETATLQLSGKYKAVKMEKVTVPLGSFDALMVSFSGTGEENNQKLTATLNGWLVKGLGPVKIEMKLTKAGDKPVTTTIVATK